MSTETNKAIVRRYFEQVIGQGRADLVEDASHLGVGVAPVAVDVDLDRVAAGLAFEIKGQTIPATARGLHMTLPTPYGIVGRIIPFNHPFGFAASRLASSSAITSVAPAVSGATICLIEAENETEAVCRYTSSVEISKASLKAIAYLATAPRETTTPFETPVEPEVSIM